MSFAYFFACIFPFPLHVFLHAFCVLSYVSFSVPFACLLMCLFLYPLHVFLHAFFMSFACLFTCSFTCFFPCLLVVFLHAFACLYMPFKLHYFTDVYSRVFSVLIKIRHFM